MRPYTTESTFPSRQPTRQQATQQQQLRLQNLSNRQSRAIDQLGNLNVGTFNAAGQRTTQQVVNIDQALQSLNTTPGGLMGASTTGSPFA